MYISVVINKLCLVLFKRLLEAKLHKAFQSKKLNFLKKKTNEGLSTNVNKNKLLLWYLALQAFPLIIHTTIPTKLCELREL